MRDNVDNRRRISFGRKVRIAWLALRENGPLWCLLLFVYYASSQLASAAFRLMDRRRRTRGLPGLNSRALNKEIWEAWDWSAAGEEWSGSPELKDSLIRCVLDKHIRPGSRVLEIGPGGGRWTGALLARAEDYLGVDIAAACVAHCRQRFANEPRARFAVGSGTDLAAAADGSMDAIWSVDVFVHINRAEADLYASEFRRVLRPGGVGVIHHGGVRGAKGGWRSDLTAETFEQTLSRHGLQVLQSFAEWKDGESLHRLDYDDLITVFAPAAR